MPIPLRYSLGAFGLDPVAADPDAAVSLASPPAPVVEDQAYLEARDNPLVFDPETRKYFRPGESVTLQAAPQAMSQTATAAAPVIPRQMAPTPEQLEQQRDRWFAQVSPLAAEGNPRAKVAIQTAHRQLVREYMQQGKSLADAMMTASLHSGLGPTGAEASMARALTTTNKPVLPTGPIQGQPVLDENQKPIPGLVATPNSRGTGLVVHVVPRTQENTRAEANQLSVLRSRVAELMKGHEKVPPTDPAALAEWQATEDKISEFNAKINQLVKLESPKVPAPTAPKRVRVRDKKTNKTGWWEGPNMPDQYEIIP